ncbi:alkylhydroperoxidase [Streptomyces sp. NPDC048606]|uniref:carboxymuconolactone decarboxylase family protein n=1 Tax=Streptomyces sp. NPDC048606 TaxID=3154726 RepID=UPI003430B783
MPHISLDNDLPGISGLLTQRPDTAGPLGALANALLRVSTPSLGCGDRELIAAYVSELNGTRFCSDSHRAFAAAQLPGGQELVKAVLADPDTAPIGARIRALLRIAAEVRGQVGPVSDAAVEAARAEGANDADIHDTVLIAAAFCMFNRYVDGLATKLPDSEGYYCESARRIVSRGYLGDR